MDGVIVPSEFLRALYRRRLGLESTVILSPVVRSRVVYEPDDAHGPRDPGGAGTAARFLTFVNPQPAKGLFYFAGIVDALSRRRPDVPVLVVEGRAGAARLERAGLTPERHPNLHVMSNTPDPRHFYAVTRALLVPSLCEDAFPRVAVEAMMNGVPVLGADRGGVGECLAGAGYLFAVPPGYTATFDARPAGRGRPAVGRRDRTAVGRPGGIRGPPPQGAGGGRGVRPRAAHA